jgi:hypothetical protein
MLYIAYSLCSLLNEMAKYKLSWNILINQTLCIKKYSYYRELWVSCFFLWHCSSSRVMSSSCHTYRRTTVGSTPLEESSTQAGYIVYLLHGAEFFLRSWPVFAGSQEIPRIFMEPESSLPYSQVPATRPYPEPTPSSPHDPLQLPEDPS